MDGAKASPPVSGWLGLDVGGTFTDLVYIASDGLMSWIKTPSTPSDPGMSTLNGVDELLATGLLSVDELDRLHHVHGTTLATNTVIERKGATVGLLTTSGFRDLLELQRLWVPNPLDFNSQRPAPLSPRALVREVAGRLDGHGTEREPLDEAGVIAAAQELVAAGAEEIVITFIHSFRNPAHESRAVELIAQALPGLPLHSSAAIWPQAREFERATLALINAYVRPRIASYVERLTSGLAARNIPTEPRSARSNGGIERSATVGERPVVALLSGPAAGIAGAIRIAQEAGWDKADLITLDIGGTSADIGVIRDGQAVLSSEEHIADFPVLIPTVAVSSIGAGGGSILSLDAAGSLRVGPRSLGADPAPACYGKQDSVPGLTDAFLLASWVGENERLGGKISLNPENARKAATPLAQALGVSLGELADGAISIAIAMMASETMRVLARRGVDAPDFRLMAFGGAGPLLGALLAEEVHIEQVLIPPSPGALSALGAALADAETDFVTPVYQRIDRVDPAALIAAAQGLVASGQAWLDAEGAAISIDGQELKWSTDMRYDGQGYDVDVPLDTAWVENGDLNAIADAFHAEHRRAYGHASRDRHPVMKELRLHVIGRLTKPAAIRLRSYGSTGVKGTRMIRIKGAEVLATLWPRDQLAADTVVHGPAIIEQLDTTTLIPPGWSARGIGLGSMLLTKGTSHG